MKIFRLLSTALMMSLPLWVAADPDNSSAEQATSASHGATPAYSLERLEWQGQLAAGNHITINNPWGDVRIRESGGTNAIFHAVMQKIGPEPKVAELKVEKNEGHITFNLVYPEDQQPGSVKEGRIDASIILPKGINISVNADRGRVLTKTLENDLTISATNADIEVKSKGRLEIDAAGANVSVLLLDGENKERGRIQTLSGNIQITYYKDVQVAFAITSGASKTTNDLPLLQSRHFEGRVLHMSKGDKPNRLQLQSDTGNTILNDLSAELPGA